MSRRDERCNGAAELIGEAPDSRRGESEPARAEPEIREPAREDDMEDERPGDRQVHPEHQAKEQRGRVEDVAIERADERHAAEQVRIPEREVAAPDHGGSELADGVAANVLVAVRRDEESAVEDRVTEDACRERVSRECPDCGAAGGPTGLVVVVGRVCFRSLRCHCRGRRSAEWRAALAPWQESWATRNEAHRSAKRYWARTPCVQKAASEGPLSDGSANGQTKVSAGRSAET